jgi:hypothetical protein
MRTFVYIYNVTSTLLCTNACPKSVLSIFVLMARQYNPLSKATEAKLLSK